MKQRITVEQLNELNEKGRERLRKWWKPRLGDVWTLEENIPNGSCYLVNSLTVKLEEDGDLPSITENETHLPRLSIGQMIEFLGENGLDMDLYMPHIMEKHLCDLLWDVCMEVLER